MMSWRLNASRCVMGRISSFSSSSRPTTRMTRPTAAWILRCELTTPKASGGLNSRPTPAHVRITNLPSFKWSAMPARIRQSSIP